VRFELTSKQLSILHNLATSQFVNLNHIMNFFNFDIFSPRVLSIALSTAFMSSGANAQFESLGFLGAGTISTPSSLSADGTMVVVGNSRYNNTNNTEAFRWTQTDGMVGLGFLGTGLLSRATGVSTDGTVVVGDSTYNNSGILQAFRWTQADGMVGLGFLGTGVFSRAIGVSADGTVVVGESRYDGTSNVQAFRWTQADGMVGLGFLGTGVDSAAFGLSTDGTVVVGSSRYDTTTNRQAFRWTQAGGMVGLGFLGNGVASTAFGLSTDGTVVVGDSMYGNGNNRQAFRWTQAGGMVGLGFLGTGVSSRASFVSADGTVVVGFSRYDGTNNPQAFRWTQADGMVGLGFLGNSLSSFANAINTDGTVIVGQSNSQAFRWTQTNGLQSVEEWLIDAGVTISSSYTMTSAIGVSADGSIIVGTASGPNGNEAYIARVSSVGSGSISLNDLESSLASSTAANNMSVNVAHTIINGLHSRPLSRLVQVGQDRTFWLSGDWGTDKHNSRDGEFGIAEAGIGRSFSWGQLNTSIGQIWAVQSLINNGRTKLDGMFLSAEALIPVSDNLWAIFGGYTHWGKSDIRRGYLNAGSESYSYANPKITTTSIRARIEMDRAYRIGYTDFSPYADLSFSKSELDAYTERAGGFPARFAKRKEKATELRLGINASKPVGNVVLISTFEATHRFEKRGTPTTGEVLGLFDFHFDGVKNQQDWIRIGAGFEGKLGDGKASLMLNATNRGEAPSYWLSAKWQKSF